MTTHGYTNPYGYTCPNCHMWVQPNTNHACIGPQNWNWQVTQTQMGCICPAGANLTCEADYCPRKPRKAAT